MLSALPRKSITDLSRRRSRTFFTVATLALAVASIGLFALPTLMNRSMNATVAADRLPDLTVYTRPLVLDPAQLAALAAVPNVRAVEPRSFFGGRVYVGARRAFAQVRGVPDFTRQSVNVVHVASGAAPATGEVLTDAQNAKHGLLHVQAGQTRADHRRRRCGASAAGQRRGPQPRRRPVRHLRQRDRAVRHASDGGVAERDPGYDELYFRLADTRPAAVTTTIAAIRRALAAVPGFTGFTDLPQTRAAGDWPGKSSFQQFTSSST